MTPSEVFSTSTPPVSVSTGMLAVAFMLWTGVTVVPAVTLAVRIPSPDLSASSFMASEQKAASWVL